MHRRSTLTHMFFARERKVAAADIANVETGWNVFRLYYEPSLNNCRMFAHFQVRQEPLWCSTFKSDALGSHVKLLQCFWAKLGTYAYPPWLCLLHDLACKMMAIRMNEGMKMSTQSRKMRVWSLSRSFWKILLEKLSFSGTFGPFIHWIALTLIRLPNARIMSFFNHPPKIYKLWIPNGTMYAKILNANSCTDPYYSWLLSANIKCVPSYGIAETRNTFSFEGFFCMLCI